MENQYRSKEHKRLQPVEDVLNELDDILSQPNELAVSNLPQSSHPNIYILGCARSGSTLFFQLLSKYLEACYPTNFLSRFYYAPYIGAKLQYLLSDLDTKNEVLAAYPDFDLSSELGKTKGPLAPHEFWYYWRRIFDINELGYIKHINSTTISDFHSGLDSVKEIFQKPMVLKGMIANIGIKEIVKDRPNDIVLFIKRDVAFNAQSLLKARETFFQDISKWYSFKLPNYNVGSNPLRQVVDQVKLTNELIENEIKDIVNPVYTIQYENLKTEFSSLLGFLENHGIQSSLKQGWSESVSPGNKINLNQKDWDFIQSIV